MGRKSRKPVRTRPKPSIPKIFECPRCETKAIRISMDSKSETSVIECGSCHLKHVLTEVRSIQEPVDIYGDFVDYYYENLASDTPYEVELKQEEVNQETMTQIAETTQIEELVAQPEEDPSVDEEVSQIEEAEKEEEEKPVVGFVPRAKGEVLKKKQKKAKEPKKLSLSDIG